MDFPEEKAIKAFKAQRSQAKYRGIGWELTYEQWRTWWGDDIAKRGTSLGDLQMMRRFDSGPYSLGNIEKGTAQANQQMNLRFQAERRLARARAALKNLLSGSEIYP